MSLYKELCNELKLSYIKENYDVLLDEAKKTGQSCGDFLAFILSNEYLKRMENRAARILKESRLPQKRGLDAFDSSVYDGKYQEDFKQLNTLRFVGEKKNLILIGSTGAGKTYYASVLGYEACKQGKSVLFITVADLIIKIKEDMSLNQISKLKSKFERYDLIILDELGYYSFEKQVAELFFNLVSARYKKGSVIITTNLNFDEWAAPFGNPKLTGALVGRLCEESYIIELEREVDGRMQNSINWRKARKSGNDEVR